MWLIGTDGDWLRGSVSITCHIMLVEALSKGIRPDDFRQRVVTESHFREISVVSDLLHDLMEELLPIQTVRDGEGRRIPRQGRV